LARSRRPWSLTPWHCAHGSPENLENYHQLLRGPKKTPRCRANGTAQAAPLENGRNFSGLSARVYPKKCHGRGFVVIRLSGRAGWGEGALLS
jgi:hypothetical protein